MVIPVNATLPDSRLSPEQVDMKFQSTSLAGPNQDHSRRDFGRSHMPAAARARVPWDDAPGAGLTGLPDVSRAAWGRAHAPDWGGAHHAPWGMGGFSGLGDCEYDESGELQCSDSNDGIGSGGGSGGGTTVTPDSTETLTTYCSWFPQACAGTPTGSGSGGGTSGGGYTGITVPAQGTPAWAALLPLLIKSGIDVAKLATVQPGTVLQANGAILRQNGGYPVPVGTSGNNGLPGVGIGLNISPTMLMVLGVGAVILFTMNNRRGAGGQ